VPPPPDEARCALHPQREALETCARCGGFVCAACLSSHAGRMVCAACAAHEAGRGTSRRAVGSVVLGVLALGLTVGATLLRQPLGCLALPLSGLGLGLGLVELAAIRSGVSPSSGRRAAGVGIWLAVVALAAAVTLTVFHGP